MLSRRSDENNVSRTEAVLGKNTRASGGMPERAGLIEETASRRTVLTAGRNHRTLAGASKMYRGEIRVAHALHSRTDGVRVALLLEDFRAGFGAVVQLADISRGAGNARIQRLRVSGTRQIQIGIRDFGPLLVGVVGVSARNCRDTDRKQ